MNEHDIFDSVTRIAAIWAEEEAYKSLIEFCKKRIEEDDIELNKLCEPREEGT